MRIFAIDPGNTESGFCLVDSETLRPLWFGKLGNESLRQQIKDMQWREDDHAAIEMVASYGMPVGEEVFHTVRWIGWYEETLTRLLIYPPTLIKRMEEKMHICHNSRATDANIRRALIDRFAMHDFKNGKGTKKNPDWFYGFKADIWAAYAVAITYTETRLKAEN